MENHKEQLEQQLDNRLNNLSIEAALEDCLSEARSSGTGELLARKQVLNKLLVDEVR
ncbi:MAG: hypothetical protein V1895_02865 [Parcubacteria group bacterium]